MVHLTTTKLVAYIIAIVVGILLLFGGGNAFAKVKETAQKIMPTIGFGQKELQGTKATVPETQQTEITHFQKKLQELMDSPKENCFVQFDGFSELPKGVSIEMNYFSGRTAVTIHGGPEGKQVATNLNFDVAGMIPCVIGGGEQYVNGFIDNYLFPGESQNPIFNTIDKNKITLALDDGGIFGRTQNRIDYGTGFKDFGGHQWLYKPDKDHICFFPTDGREEGLPVDFITLENDPTSLAYRVKNGLLKQC